MTWLAQLSRSLDRGRAAAAGRLLQLSGGLRSERALAAAPAAQRSGPGTRSGLAAAGDGGGGDGSSAAPGAPPSTHLAMLCGRFKNRAHGNDAAGAEHWFRIYVKEGGEPQSWMLAMLLGSYGRLRQADKAWAVYQELLQVEQQRQQQQEQWLGEQQQRRQQQEQWLRDQRLQQWPQEQQRPAAGQQPGGQQRRAGAPGRQQQQQQVGGWDTAQQLSVAGNPPQQAVESATAAAASEPNQQQQQQRGVVLTQHQQQRQRYLADEAEWLVKELQLDRVPMENYVFGTLITALSRGQHPPYDLPVHYAEKAAAAFADAQRRGVVPNVVLWHNLIDCQAKAGLADAAFATYHSMRAAGCQPTSWAYSMLISACGRGGQPHRAAEVVDRLMPQAGVLPSLPVWNSLLGAYGRTGSVDAAYAAWMKMLESGAIPDDCTERVLAQAFGSHPSLAADVVAEARQIQQRRQGAADAAAAAAAAAAAGARQRAQARQQQQEQQWQAGGLADGGGGSSSSSGLSDEAAAVAAAAAAAAEDAAAARLGVSPYRLHRHRQAPLAMSHDHVSKRSQANNRPLGLLLDHGGDDSSGGGGADTTALAGDLTGSGGGSSSSSRQQQQAEGERGLQLRQLLLLDLHGSSQAAARMVLLRRLEALVLQADDLIEEMDRIEQQWHKQQEWRQLHLLLQKQRQVAAAELEQALAASGGGGGSSGGSLTEGAKGYDNARQRQGQQQQQQQGPEAAQQGGRQWAAIGGLQSDQLDAAAAAAAGGGSEPNKQQQGQQQGQQQWQQQGQQQAPRFCPPTLQIITGMGQHSRGGRGGGVLKAAVRQLLKQQGLPARDHPTNSGVVLVPWPQLSAYLQRQRQSMNTDRFLTAARARYTYILAGVAGVMAAAHIVPRLAPWMA